MLTTDEIRAVPLFSTLDLGALEQLARTSEDLRLKPGEFAVHEGGERALFAVLAGRIEVIKLFDGVERTLGWRVPGAIFGEVPLALGAPFPAAIGRPRPRASCVSTLGSITLSLPLHRRLPQRSARSRASASVVCRALLPNLPSRV